MKISFRSLAVKTARYADDKKGEDIIVFDVSKNSYIADFAVVVSADSSTQLEAIDDYLNLKLKEEGFPKLHRDGTQSKLWRVADYGGLIVHILTPETRQFYALDKLFSLAKKVNWSAAEPAKKKPAKPARRKAVKK